MSEALKAPDPAKDVVRDFHRRDKPEWPDSPHVSGLLEGIISSLPPKKMGTK